MNALEMYGMMKLTLFQDAEVRGVLTNGLTSPSVGVEGEPFVVSAG